MIARLHLISFHLNGQPYEAVNILKMQTPMRTNILTMRDTQIRVHNSIAVYSIVQLRDVNRTAEGISKANESVQSKVILTHVCIKVHENETKTTGHTNRVTKVEASNEENRRRGRIETESDAI